MANAVSKYDRRWSVAPERVVGVGATSTPDRGVARLAPLDGIRGLAIAAVMLFHFSRVTPAPATSTGNVVNAVLGQGWAGVDLFFVLSGFLITGILLDAGAGAPGGWRDVPSGYFRAFYARRALRIFPAYYLFLAVMLLVVRYPAPAGQWWYWSYLTNALVSLKGWRPAGELGHLWSLAVEEQFYLIWPLCLALTPRRWILPLCSAAILLGPITRAVLVALGSRFNVSPAPDWAFVLTPARMDALALGGYLAALGRQHGEAAMLALRRPLIVLGVSATATAVAAALAWPMAPQVSWWWLGQPSAVVLGYTGLAAFCAALLLAALDPANARLQRFATNPLLSRLGLYSYACYLVHHVVRQPARAWAQIPGTGPAASWGAWVWYMVVASAATIAIAAASWVLFERHWLALKRHVPMPRRATVLSREATNPDSPAVAASAELIGGR